MPCETRMSSASPFIRDAQWVADDAASVHAVVAAVVALFTYSLRSAAQSDPGPGHLDALHVSAARAVILALPTLPGTTLDPYDTACRAPATLCVSS